MKIDTESQEDPMDVNRILSAAQNANMFSVDPNGKIHAGIPGEAIFGQPGVQGSLFSIRSNERNFFVNSNKDHKKRPEYFMIDSPEGRQARIFSAEVEMMTGKEGKVFPILNKVTEGSTTILLDVSTYEGETLTENLGVYLTDGIKPIWVESIRIDLKNTFNALVSLKDGEEVVVVAQHTCFKVTNVAGKPVKSSTDQDREHYTALVNWHLGLDLISSLHKGDVKIKTAFAGINMMKTAALMIRTPEIENLFVASFLLALEKGLEFRDDMINATLDIYGFGNLSAENVEGLRDWNIVKAPKVEIKSRTRSGSKAAGRRARGEVPAETEETSSVPADKPRQKKPITFDLDQLLVAA